MFPQFFPFVYKSHNLIELKSTLYKQNVQILREINSFINVIIIIIVILDNSKSISTSIPLYIDFFIFKSRSFHFICFFFLSFFFLYKISRHQMINPKRVINLINVSCGLYRYIQNIFYYIIYHLSFLLFHV